MTARCVSVLGATGSVGQSTLDIIKQSPDDFTVDAVTAHANVDQLVADAVAVKARKAVIADPNHFAALKQAVSGLDIEPMAGQDALDEVAAGDADLIVGAIVGAAGLRSTVAAIRAGKTVALANKETLVCAGEVVMAEAAQYGATLLPVDSEHSALFQVYNPKQAHRVTSLTLTASGGPFRHMTRAQMAQVTPEQAVAHPNWSMGAKISVDSATMMNKGLEVIEAAHLFPISLDKIDVLVHPQSVIHGMVTYSDGSVLAQLGAPDMRTPIAVAMAWPDRLDVDVDTLSLADMATLTFEQPDLVQFPCLRLARDSLKEGSGACAVLNAANEVAVGAFLNRQIGFLDIERVVEQSLAKVNAGHISAIEDAESFDEHARRVAHDLL